jgi:DNA-binding transcriptional MerR regulator
VSKLLQRLDEGKLYYSISEVCRMTGLEAHVLRYWETEFAQMRPRKNRAGNRAYRPREIQYIQYIRHLLHEEKYTLQGAKKKLAEVTFEEVSGQTTLLRMPPVQPQAPAIETTSVDTPATTATSVTTTGLTDSQRQELASIRDGLKDVLKMLGQ